MVSTNTLYRLGGAALMAGGVLAMGAHLIHPDPPTDGGEAAAYIAATMPGHMMLGSAAALISLGLVAVIVRQRERAGWLGLLGALAVILGTLAGDGLHSVIEAFAFPVVLGRLPFETAVPIAEGIYSTPQMGMISLGSMLILLPGLALLAAASWRARLFPRWVSLTLATPVAIMPLMLALPLPEVVSRLTLELLYASFVGFGLHLLIGRPEPQAKVPPLSAFGD